MTQPAKPTQPPTPRPILPDRVTFDQADLDNVLANLSDAQVDELAFGAIQVDRDGRVLTFNATESRMTNRDPKDVIGKDFFNEVAPCTRRPEFYGRFQEGVRTGKLSVIFDYIFDYKMAPTKVRVHMKKAMMDDTYWMFVKRV